MSSKKTIALLSSGLDSSVALWLAQKAGWEISLALTFHYGQRAATREVAQAALLAKHFSIPHRVVELPWFTSFASGLLSAHTALPQPSLEQLNEAEASQASAKAVWVPNRNGIFLEIAAGFAEASGAEGVLVGFNREEAATFPDNSEAFLDAINDSLAFSTATKVRAFSPIAPLYKKEIVRAAKADRFPFSLLWSCYEARAEMCGRCESCMRLKRALHAEDLLREVAFEDARLS